MSKYVWIRNLGCPKNEVDGGNMESLLVGEGYRITEESSQADIFILNTCGFIQPAKEESIEELFDLVKLKAQDGKKKIVVCGCLAQRYPRELWVNIPEIDAVLGITEIGNIHSICSSVLKGKRILRVGTPDKRDSIKGVRRISNGRPFAYIKIADGCDNRCSYCAIPGIRGGFRSKRIRHIVDEAHQLAEQGVREINLVAQDTTQYGVDLYGKKRLPELLTVLSQVKALKWIRLLYTHPAHFTDELIEQIASNPKVCKYVDLPLQHVSDEILKKMNRRVNKKQVEQLIFKLRERIPDLTLRTSFIVGFPGERKRHFEELLEFAEEIRFEKLGAFVYSREEGTKAYDARGQISSKEKQERLGRLMLAQQRIARGKNRDKMGKTLTVLIDALSEDGGRLFMGRSEAEAPDVDGMVLVIGKRLKPGQFVQVRVVDYDDYDLVAETLKEVKHG